MLSMAQKPEVIATLVMALLVFILFITRRLPSMQGVIDCANVLNSKGGNLLLLAIMSFWFFAIAVRFAYYLISLMVNKTLTPDNAIALSTFNFITGTAFGGAFGALLKGMSGETVTAAGTSKMETTVSSTSPAAPEPPVVPDPPIIEPGPSAPVGEPKKENP